MSERYFDCTGDVKEIGRFIMTENLKRNGETLTPPTSVVIKDVPIATVKDFTTDEDNFVATYFYNYDNRVYKASSSHNYYTGRLFHNISRIGCKIELDEGVRWCIIRCKTDVGLTSGTQRFPNDHYYVDSWLILGNTNTGAKTTKDNNTDAFNYEPSIKCDDGELLSMNINTSSSYRPPTNTTQVVSTAPLTRVTTANFDGQYRALSDTVINGIKDLEQRLINASTANPKHCAMLTANVSNYTIQNGLPNGCYCISNNVRICTLDKIPNFIPVFDARDDEDTSWIDNAYDYLINNDRHGDVDPFTPEYPKKETIEDYATNYRVFVTPYEENKARTKFSVIAYNGDLINYYDDLVEEYHMTVEESTSTSSWRVVQTTPMEMYPTVGFHTSIPQNVLYGIRMSFHNDGNTESGAKFNVTFEYKEDSAVHCAPKGVYRDGQTCSRSPIVDGYRYTASTGEWVEILYRTPTIEDLDDSYPNPEDSEDDRTGTDTDFLVGNGLNTFAITGAQFGQINKKLWSTDWTQVFKSSSIDPIRCVIGCKGIPFTATPSAMDNIIIANLDTGVDANTCKPVKSFDIGTIAMPSFRGDFSDVTMTRVHLYLPFIGWVDLPSSEVISRVAHADVGITANKKRLGFKYIVDFVDGSCRCVVSVNGSERWFFDGHCDVDIPVTSDNHTQAVGNAIRSGVGAVLSVASAVGGAIAENPMMIATGLVGAISNGANVIPTYNYSASSSPSGYINASMNNHIMIVIEHPNLVMGSNFAHKNGRPCGLTLSLGSLRGYTRCINVDTSGINGTETELSMIKSMLESGVYL